MGRELRGIVGGAAALAVLALLAAPVGEASGSFVHPGEADFWQHRDMKTGAWRPGRITIVAPVLEATLATFGGRKVAPPPEALAQAIVGQMAGQLEQLGYDVDATSLSEAALSADADLDRLADAAGASLTATFARRPIPLQRELNRLQRGESSAGPATTKLAGQVGAETLLLLFAEAANKGKGRKTASVLGNVALVLADALSGGGSTPGMSVRNRTTLVAILVDGETGTVYRYMRGGRRGGNAAESAATLVHRALRKFPAAPARATEE